MRKTSCITYNGAQESRLHNELKSNDAPPEVPKKIDQTNDQSIRVY